jgi:hypothetical protein
VLSARSKRRTETKLSEEEEAALSRILADVEK